jgi:hypothetical protein
VTFIEEAHKIFVTIGQTPEIKGSKNFLCYMLILFLPWILFSRYKPNPIFQDEADIWVKFPAQPCQFPQPGMRLYLS